MRYNDNRMKGGRNEKERQNYLFINWFNYSIKY